MTFCHGSGDPPNDGCCYVSDGTVCPLRYKIDGGRILEGPDLVDRGTVEEYVRGAVKGKGNQDRVLAQLTGIRYACRAAVEVIAADAKLLTDRPAFEAAWDGHADYVALVREPHWTVIEERTGLPPGSYQCSTWRGFDTTPHCCFREDPVTNDEKAAGLSAEARQLRQAGGT